MTELRVVQFSYWWLNKWNSRYAVVRFCLSPVWLQTEYTVFTNGGHAGKNWCLVMKARRWRINKNCKWRLSVKLAECLARIPPKITFYGLFFKYNYVGCLLLVMSSNDLLFAIKRDAYQKFDKWTMAGEKRQTCWPKLHIETEYESQLTAIRWNRNINKSWWQEKKK